MWLNARLAQMFRACAQIRERLLCAFVGCRIRRRHPHHVNDLVRTSRRVVPGRQLVLANLDVHSMFLEVLHFCPCGVWPLVYVVALHGLRPSTLPPMPSSKSSLARLPACVWVVVLLPVSFPRF
eukprot:2205444-Pleurochrysis_carterae.AAC.1